MKKTIMTLTNSPLKEFHRVALMVFLVNCSLLLVILLVEKLIMQFDLEFTTGYFVGTLLLLSNMYVLAYGFKRLIFEQKGIMLALSSMMFSFLLLGISAFGFHTFSLTWLSGFAVAFVCLPFGAVIYALRVLRDEVEQEELISQG